MKTVRADLILASRNSLTGDILYTFKLTFPRIILAEVNTHTVASKNTASSRAIPTPTQLKRIWQDPFVPLSIGQYRSGMQAGDEITGLRRWLIERIWRCARVPNLAASWLLYKLGAPKQVCNRLPEAHMWIEQIFSTTDTCNLLKLRDSAAAEPHFHALASQVRSITSAVEHCFAYPKVWQPEISDRCQSLLPGEWHLPFVGLWQDVADSRRLTEFCLLLTAELASGDITFEKHSYVLPDKVRPYVIGDLTEVAKKVSAGRCAWVSYYMPGDDSRKMSSLVRAIETYRKLAESDPKHLSPLQHQATPLPKEVRCGNYVGFLQYRKQVPGESGGDKVVPSVVPSVAQHLVNSWRLEQEAKAAQGEKP